MILIDHCGGRQRLEIEDIVSDTSTGFKKG